MDEFVSVNKHMKGRESKILIHRDKETKELTANCSLKILDINYVTCSRKYV